jgi:hypothetical protein
VSSPLGWLRNWRPNRIRVTQLHRSKSDWRRTQRTYVHWVIRMSGFQLLYENEGRQAIGRRPLPHPEEFVV